MSKPQLDNDSKGIVTDVLKHLNQVPKPPSSINRIEFVLAGILTIAVIGVVTTTIIYVINEIVV